MVIYPVDGCKTCSFTLTAFLSQKVCAPVLALRRSSFQWVNVNFNLNVNFLTLTLTFVSNVITIFHTATIFTRPHKLCALNLIVFHMMMMMTLFSKKPMNENLVCSLRHPFGRLSYLGHLYTLISVVSCSSSRSFLLIDCWLMLGIHRKWLQIPKRKDYSTCSEKLKESYRKHSDSK